MSPGQAEIITQKRVVRLFRDELKYEYLGDWEKREDNRNVEPGLLRAWLLKRGVDEALINRAIFQLEKTAGDQSKSLYDRNKAVYELLRYGVKVKPDVGENTETVWLIDWKKPLNNDFAIAEEVTVPGADSKAKPKRPDVVIYVNGIALGVLELKRSSVSVSAGIRQNLDNQKKIFIQQFFSTQQLIMAGNDSQGVRYGAIETPEKYYLAWKEDSPVENRLDRDLIQLCGKERFLELIHDFIVFDSGVKKVCRHNQYFGVRAAKDFIGLREGGIIWHTQGSGKSLTMVWLAKWIRENCADPRVLIITDRVELDSQIEDVFMGVNEGIYRTKSGADLIATLNASDEWLMCSLIHKFGGKEEGDVDKYLEDVKNALPKDFRARGNIYVFVDECHRTQSGLLHDAMKAILPDAVFVGFTGTPLLREDKKRSLEVFGRYIHTYKYDEAVKDGVVLDLRYEARDIDQQITSQAKIDQWFEARTQGLTDLAKAQLKQRWGTMQKLLSSQSRLEKIVSDIMMDMSTRTRLMDGRGNAMLVCGSIYEACKIYELFNKTELKGKCAIVTSYRPGISDIKGEDAGEGATEKLRQYEIYRNMLAEWFDEPPETAVNKVERFEDEVKKKFVKEPGQMRLLIVVDKLLTGFDAPPATYLYIDKKMRDHGLFQAICRVNRLDGEDKDYGYIIDYKDLFRSLEGAVQDYTSGALDGYDKEDVAGLLEDRLEKGRERLEEAREAVKALCEPVEPPKDTPAYIRYFCAVESGNMAQLKENESKRLALYKLTAALLRAYANLANEMEKAGFTQAEINTIKAEVKYYESACNEVKLASGDYIDLKMYEPAMRYLIDNYIQARESEKISAFDDMSLVELIIERGPGVVEDLPEGIRKDKDAAAETIENNVRKLIIDESPINPKYYEKMSELLDALIEQRKQQAVSYGEYLKLVAELTRKAKNPGSGSTYPASINSQTLQSLYDNLNKNEALSLAVDKAVRGSLQDNWRNNLVKVKMVKQAIKAAIKAWKDQDGEETGDASYGRVKDNQAGYESEGDLTVEELADRILQLAKDQNDY